MVLTALIVYSRAIASTLRVAAWLALTALVGACSRPPRAFGSAESEAGRVLTWTLGGMRRDPMPATGDALLLLVPTGRPAASGKILAKVCAGATSFLPAPDGRGRFFFACDGVLFVRHTGSTSRMPGQDPDLHIWDLLAFRAAQSPLEMLVSATPEGTAETQLWLLQIQNDSLVNATRVRGLDVLASQEAFFAAFRVPRCLAPAHRCLYLNRQSNNEPCSLDVWDGRPESVTPLQDLDGASVQDVAWASGDGKWLYLLVGQP